MITGTLSDRVAALMPQGKTELAELVAMRSVADPRQFPQEERPRAAQGVLDRSAGVFGGVGFTGLRPGETADGSTAVHGSRPSTDPDAPTVLLYAHSDVQPLLDQKAWRTTAFELTERDGRWYGRGSHLELIVEGSEEQGTGGLEAFMPPNTDLRQAPNESVAPSEIQNMAPAEAAILCGLGEKS